MADEPTIVSAVAVSVNSFHGDEVSARLEKAMADEVLKCNEEGISTSEENSTVIRERMRAAHDRELAAILEESHG